MKLNRTSLKDVSRWSDAGIRIPQFDMEKMLESTSEKPVWVHFGAGNIFRGFIACLQQTLLEKEKAKSGIVAVDTFDYDIIDKIYRPFDNLTLMVGLKPDGTTEKSVVGSVATSLKADISASVEMEQLKAIFVNPHLQMVSYTITEKGYALKDMNGEWLPAAAADMNQGPLHARHVMGISAALILERYQAGAYPLALVSMDNCSHNGEILKNGVLTIAQSWVEHGFAEKGFLEYLSDENQVAFPWSMIDKITPRPAKEVEEMLIADGIEMMEPIVTSRKTFIAPFVNAEIPEYLVLEDLFPNGRPELEAAGVYMTDRDTVNNAERMKVMTCLNPLHTALAVFGCLLGYDSIAQEMKDPDLKLLVEKIGYGEGMPVVIDPGIIKPLEFIQEVIDCRLPNPFIPDSPQRIATDTSQKMAIRFGETIKAYLNHSSLEVQSLTYIPLVIAGWMRYLLAVDDQGKRMEVSGDPLLGSLQSSLQGITVGETQSYKGQLKEILANTTLFGVDLTQAGLAEKIEDMFVAMLPGTGAVRRTLKQYLEQNR